MKSYLIVFSISFLVNVLLLISIYSFYGVVDSFVWTFVIIHATVNSLLAVVLLNRGIT